MKQKHKHSEMKWNAFGVGFGRGSMVWILEIKEDDPLEKNDFRGFDGLQK